jgi:serine/threonine protein kinase
MIDENGCPILADFGKAKQLANDEDDVTTSIEGTQIFLSPECCDFNSTTHSMKKADVWALGLTFYCLAFNKLPFGFAKTDLKQMEYI